MKRRAVLISSLAMVLLTFLAGCATLPSHEKMASEVQGYSLPKQNAGENTLVYVVRPSWAGKFVRFNVFLDDKEDVSEMGYTRGSQHIYFFVNPGKHVIFSKAENWAEINIDAKAGETIFLKQSPEIGILIARNSLELIGDIEGKYHIKNTGIGTIIKELK